MGYESKLYVVDKGSATVENPDGRSRKWSNIIAMFDLSVCHAVADAFTRVTDSYFYATAGNHEEDVIVDRYGEPLKEMTVPELVVVLENLDEDTATYRRIPPLLAMLRAFLQPPPEGDNWNEPAVLHYGH